MYTINIQQLLEKYNVGILKSSFDQHNFRASKPEMHHLIIYIYEQILQMNDTLSWNNLTAQHSSYGNCQIK